MTGQKNMFTGQWEERGRRKARKQEPDTGQLRIFSEQETVLFGCKADPQIPLPPIRQLESPDREESDGETETQSSLF